MNVFELIKEKLEEVKTKSSHMEILARVYYEIALEDTISIVDEVAQEYKRCELCYLGSPCEYQNENIKMPVSALADSNGWIPCKKELPQITNSYLVTIKCEDDGKPIYETSHEIFWLKDNKWDCERDADCEWEVTAWQNKLEPYKEGGSDDR